MPIKRSGLNLATNSHRFCRSLLDLDLFDLPYFSDMEFQLKKSAPAIIVACSLLLFAYVVSYVLGVMEVATDHSLSPDQRAREAWRSWVVLPSVVTSMLGLVHFWKQGHDRLVVFVYLGVLILVLILGVMSLVSSGWLTEGTPMRLVLLPVTAVTSVFLVYRFFAKR